MKNKQIGAIVFIGLIIGMALGFGVGALAGVYVSGVAITSFIEKIELEEVNFNLDLNETAITEAMIPYMNLTEKEEDY